MFTVLFAIGRTRQAGSPNGRSWQDKEQKIARPKQVYTGIQAGRPSRSANVESSDLCLLARRPWKLAPSSLFAK